MHGRSCGIGFADGHAEVHTWQNAQTIQPVTYRTYLQAVNVTADQDLLWLALHTPRAP
jgi:prepilin-type processing-associated H-X9-DG protein